ncbi:MAG: GNAT family N-acetyltransferase [Ruminiclostridium sp.]
MKVELKTADFADTGIMMHICNDAFRADYEKFGDSPGYGRSAQSFVDSMKNGIVKLICANGSVVGVLTAFQNNNSIYIGTFAILPEYQRKAIGTKALELFVKQYPCKRYDLDAPAENKHCLDFYGKLGFKETARRIDGKVQFVCLQKEMELFDEMDGSGNPTGRLISRAEAHRTGAWHKSVHIWVVRGEKVLMQRRAMSKDSFPGCIDASCTGHVDAGETFTEAAVRELNEEIGLEVTADDLHCFMQQTVINKDDTLFNREYNVVYLLDSSVPLDTLKCDQSEIDDLFWIDLESLRSAVELGNKKYCIIPSEFRAVYSLIKRGVK